MLSFNELSEQALKLKEEAELAMAALTAPADRTQFNIANQVISLLDPLAAAFRSFIPPVEMDMSSISITDPTLGNNVEPVLEPEADA